MLQVRVVKHTTSKQLTSIPPSHYWVSQSIGFHEQYCRTNKKGHDAISPVRQSIHYRTCLSICPSTYKWAGLAGQPLDRHILGHAQQITLNVWTVSPTLCLSVRRISGWLQGHHRLLSSSPCQHQWDQTLRVPSSGRWHISALWSRYTFCNHRHASKRKQVKNQDMWIEPSTSGINLEGRTVEITAQRRSKAHHTTVALLWL